MYLIVLKSGDLARVEGARIPMPAEFKDLTFFVHNAPRARSDGRLDFDESGFLVSEGATGCGLGEAGMAYPTPESAAAAALEALRKLGFDRVRAASLMWVDRYGRLNP